MSPSGSIELHWNSSVVILVDPGLFIVLPTIFKIGFIGEEMYQTSTKPLNFIELHWRFVTQIDPRLSTVLLMAFETDSGSGVACLTLMRPSSSIKLLLHSVPLAILIDLCLLTTLLPASKTDSSSSASCLT